MTRLALWITAVLLFVVSAIVAINFVGFGIGFPIVFLFVAAIPVFVVIYPLWQRREKDEAAQREAADPSVSPIEQPDYRAPWR